MIIDSHQHFWNYDAVRDGWIDESMHAIRRDFTPADLEPLLSSFGVDGTIAVQASESRDETEFLLELAENNAWILKVVGWISMCSSTIEKELEGYAEIMRLTGFREILQKEPPETMLSEDFQRGMRALSDTRFTFDLLIYPHHLPAATILAERFPHQLFVVDHLAKPSVLSGEIDEWRTQIERIAQLPNVYCKLSGLLTEADWYSWQLIHLRPYMDVVMNAFGAGRVMFGSDWPVTLLAGSYKQAIDSARAFLSELSVGERSAVMGGTAQRFYGIEE